MPNTREKLIELLNGTPNVLIANKASVNIADYLISNGVTIHTTCEHCQCSDTISCPRRAGMVWQNDAVYETGWILF